MQLHIILLNIAQLLFIICEYVQMTPVLEKTFPTIKYINKTNEIKLKLHLSICISDKDCHIHGSCRDSRCICEKGWITWDNGQQCSYKQSSKTVALILSFTLGSTGIDWFILSRKESLYILCGILKLLITAGCCIWSPLAIKSSNQNSMTAASCLSIWLALITVIWWFIDWIRILVNSFPDGNGAPLV